MTTLTVGDTRPFVQYAADGAQTAFTFPFPIMAAGDLKVVFDDGAAASAHTITGVGESDGGTVTFDQPPPAGTRVTLYRDMPVARSTDFVESGEFRASALNAELDRLTMMIQQVEASDANALRRAPHDADGPLEVPAREARRDTVLAFDSDGWPTVLADPVLAAAQASDSAEAAAQSADDASASATQAGNSATAAHSSATAAAASEDKARQWAEEDTDVEVETNAFSARHWARKAEDASVNMPDERWRTDLAIQRVRWTALAPSVAEPPAWSVDFVLGLGLDGLSVSRAGPATYHDAQGQLVTAASDVLRIDHDPDTWTPLGALIEDARTNVLHDSFNPASQTRALDAGIYTVSVKGTGSCDLSGAATGTVTAGAPLTFTLASTGEVTFSVSGTLQAFQCEEGASATSFIETPSGGSATRAADLVTASDLAWLRPAGLSVVAEARLADVPAQGVVRLLSLDAGGDADRHNLYWNGSGGRVELFTKSGGASQSSVNVLDGGWSDGAAHTLAMAVGGGARKLFADGTKGGADTITDPAAPTVLRIGSYHAGNQWNGHLRRVSVWNRHLDDAALAALTG